MAVGGTWLGLGAVGLLAAGVQLRRRGSRAPAALSEVQQQLLRLKNQYREDPEVAIRAQDLVITLLPSAVSAGPGGLPGLWRTNADLVSDIRQETGNPEATLSDYLDFVSRQIRENKHFSGRSLQIQVAWTRFIPWISREVSRLIRAGRAGQIPVRAPRWGQPPSQEELVRRQLGGWVENLPEIFDWAGVTTPDILRLTYRQASARSARWHGQAERQRKAEEARVRAMQQEERLRYLESQGEAARCKDGVAQHRGEVLHTFADGWTIQKLTTWPQFVEEGNLSKGGGCLRHCVGESHGSYFVPSQRGAFSIQSLRDPENRPVLTLTVYPEGNIEAALGLKDRQAGTVKDVRDGPALARRHGFADIHDLLLTECRHLTAWAELLRPGDPKVNWSCANLLAREEERRLAALQAGRQAEGQGGPNRRGGRGSRQRAPDEEFGISVVAVNTRLGRFPLPMLVRRRRGRWDEVLLTPPPELILAPPRRDERDMPTAEVYLGRVRSYAGFLRMASAALNEVGEDAPEVAGDYEAIDDQVHYRTGMRGGTVWLGEVPAYASPETVATKVAGGRPQARRRDAAERERISAFVARAINAANVEEEAAPQPAPVIQVQAPRGRGAVIPFRRRDGTAARTTGRKRSR